MDSGNNTIESVQRADTTNDSSINTTHERENTSIPNAHAHEKNDAKGNRKTTIKNNKPAKHSSAEATKKEKTKKYERIAAAKRRANIHLKTESKKNKNKKLIALRSLVAFPHIHTSH